MPKTCTIRFLLLMSQSLFIMLSIRALLLVVIYFVWKVRQLLLEWKGIEQVLLLLVVQGYSELRLHKQ